MKAVTSTGPTTGTITVSNIWDNGWKDITFTLDWTDPANRTVTLVQQNNIADGTTVSSSYPGTTVAVVPYPGEVGTFSICSQTITLKMGLCLNPAGCFNNLYTVNLAR